MSINHLVSALPIVAQALGDRYGVEVVISGSQACTTGRTIHLPALPPDDETATLLARGYLDHESGHIRHTDFGALPHDATPLLRRRLTGLVQASRLRCDRIGRRGQQLAPRQLHRLRLGDARVFLQRRERVGVNTAVLLLLDMSGSMRGLPIEIARQTVWAAAEALYGIAGIQVAAGAFPAGSQGVFPLLAFGESPRRTIDRFALAAANTTPLAEALWWAAQRIVLRPEPRKLVIVATDGDPDDSAAARDIVDRLGAAGVEVGGLGILTMVVRELFPFHTVAGTFQEVPEALFRLLQGRLR